LASGSVRLNGYEALVVPLSVLVDAVEDESISSRREFNKSNPKGSSIIHSSTKAEKVAYDLIGCRLNWRSGNESDSRIITETEAYTGPNDLASHAARGRTERNGPMFGPPGNFYVYFVYGMHWMLNVVTGPVGYPAAVLIRGVEGILGPGRLTKALRINGNLNGKAAKKETGVWFSERSGPIKNTITRSSRIGVSYAGPIWSVKPYRFTLD
jgi:DNA-3-methyladenine glycosylase